MPLTDRPKPTGLIRLWRAFGNTAKGYIGAFIEEAAFRQELALCVLLFPVGLWLGQDGIERALLVGPLFVILIVELLNSAIEATVDRIGLERHVGRVKSATSCFGHGTRRFRRVISVVSSGRLAATEDFVRGGERVGSGRHRLRSSVGLLEVDPWWRVARHRDLLSKLAEFGFSIEAEGRARELRRELRSAGGPDGRARVGILPRVRCACRGGHLTGGDPLALEARCCLGPLLLVVALVTSATIHLPRTDA